MKLGRIFWVLFLNSIQVPNKRLPFSAWLVVTVIMLNAFQSIFFFFLLIIMASCDNCSSLRLAHFFYLDFIIIINTDHIDQHSDGLEKKIIPTAIKQAKFFFLPHNENCVIDNSFNGSN